jgi:hypothetical protein
VRRRPDPVVLGGDLNLKSAARSCLPNAYRQADDGAAQHVATTGGFTIAARRTIGMDGTTDHPGLLVDLVREAP